MKLKSNYKNVEIYSGIDVHKKSWEIKSVSDHASLKRAHMTEPSAEKLANYLRTNFPNAIHRCVYEAGFSGYWLQEELSKLGIETIIVHPGDVPTTDKEKRSKSDKVDCKKLALSMRSGQLSGIFVPKKEQQNARSIVRLRYQNASDQRRLKNRIKSHLCFYGIKLDEQQLNEYWSKRYINLIEEMANELQDKTLLLLLEKLKSERHFVLQSTRLLRQLSKEENYEGPIRLLRSIPGVGLLTAMVYLTEIGSDVSRFKKDDNYISYIGFVPTMKGSGEKSYAGHLSKRGNKRLRTALILSAWMSIRSSGKMLAEYQRQKQRGLHSNKAIVKIARKLAMIMKAILRDSVLYKE